jgi:hypothetical protein
MPEIVPISPDEVHELSDALTELHELLGHPAVHSDTEIVRIAIDTIKICKSGLAEIRQSLGLK